MRSDDFSHPVARLFPPEPTGPAPLLGLYLHADLPDRGRCGPWVYSNYVTTLDGRISLVDQRTGVEGVPDTIADPRDWRLFQELACRADVLIASGRYMRNLHAGTAQDVLPLGESEAFEDLRAWREAHGLSPQPDVAVVSASLDFSIPPVFIRQQRRIVVLTAGSPPPQRIQALEDTGARVIRVNAGDRVSGAKAINCLGNLGYRRVYAVAGPQVLHTLVSDDALDTLFLTLRHRLVGGTGSSILSGSALAPPMDLTMRWLYQDLTPDAVGQCFSRFDRQ